MARAGLFLGRWFSPIRLRRPTVVERLVWSIRVSGNWRLTFEFRDGDAHVLDYEDYH